MWSEKQSSSKNNTMLLGRAIQAWEVMKNDMMTVGVKSLSVEKYLLLAVDKASRFPVAYPLPSKQVEDVARHL